MEKRKRWQYGVIFVAIMLTIYNILPTLFYYSQPLGKSVDERMAIKISHDIANRVNDLEKQSTDWLYSFCDLIGVKPKTINLDKNSPEKITLDFINEDQANLFSQYLPRAGSLISFVPSQLTLGKKNDDQPNQVVVQRQIPIHFDLTSNHSPFFFTEKFNNNKEPTNGYKKLVFDRALILSLSIAGPSESSQLLSSLNTNIDPTIKSQILSSLCQNIITFKELFGIDSSITKRYFNSFSQTNQSVAKPKTIASLLSAFQAQRDSLKLEKIKVEKEKPLDETDKNRKIALLQRKEDLFSKAEKILEDKKTVFSNGRTPWSSSSTENLLNQTYSPQVQTLKIEDNNPFFKQISIDWKDEKITLHLHDDVHAFEKGLEKNDKKVNQLKQLIINEIARVSRLSSEKISPTIDHFTINLSSLSGSASTLSLDLGKIAAQKKTQLISELKKNFSPSHTDLLEENYPIIDFETYNTLPLSKKSLGLITYAPAENDQEPVVGMNRGSIYVIAKGLSRIVEKYQKDPTSSEAKDFFNDFAQLKELLQSDGFFAYPGSYLTKNSEFFNDFIFEKRDFYQNLLKATRENFEVSGTKRFASLPLSTVEQRILTQNKIENQIHEDLIKWRDEYNSSLVSLQQDRKFTVPKPTKNIFLNNVNLSLKKYFRGDENKVLHWGLDLSGGKAVQIELRDQNNQRVTNEDDIRQGINELYNRVNKMGVSEVSIRQEGTTIALDFPGSQAISASELIKSSSMFFHIVNEKFSTNNHFLADSINRFLQEVWNEALVTNQTTAQGVNKIAFKHLFGDLEDSDSVQPRSEAAQILYENGLRLALPEKSIKSSAFDDSTSMIAVVKEESLQRLSPQAHPLLITFHNYALEGASLKNIRSNYDPSKGYLLNFEVESSVKEGATLSPSQNFHNWTSAYSQETVGKSGRQDFSNGQGWRMAIVFNDSVISAPCLNSPLSTSAYIQGKFTQREVNRLTADLKAGSLTYTPKILSEKNISPELGSQERSQGIMATLIALLLVIITMTTYYRFAGIVASLAVLFNLLILWAVLQNIQATLSLAGIAGVILTVGMAVDANVLVFERIREEYEKTKRIAESIKIGYQKAFTAIFDSNITTLMSGVILLNFDSGPVKGFALTLIIGIVSSMFTALFATRFFFAGWVKNKKNTSLKMLNWIKDRNYNFLKKSKYVMAFSLLLILIGNFALYQQKKTLFGMDFTGGYAINLEVDSKRDDLKEVVASALIKGGASSQEAQVRELDLPNQLKVYLSSTMETEGKPFNGMPLSVDDQTTTYSYENNPRINWVVSALEKEGLSLTEKSKVDLSSNWTAMSGQMSETMKNNAIWGLSLALLAILIYITIRFEFKFAFSAMLCLIHDVLISLGIVALLHSIGVPVQIDLNTIAALMLIIGYSLNDTIVIFDRIREDLSLNNRSSLAEVINSAINTTLSRTVLTSFTTFIVLVALVLFGGSSIFGFSLVMALGVIFGTLSSIFIASPIMLYFHRKEEKKITLTVLSE